MNKLFVLALVWFQASVSYAQIKREDVLECGLPSGTKFVLRSSYEWYPQALILPGDAAERMDQSNFKTIFVSDKKNIEAGSFPFSPVEQNAQELCAVLGEKNGIVYRGGARFFYQGEFVSISQGETLRVHDDRSMNSVEINSALDKYAAFPLGIAITISKSRLVHERALVDKQNNRVVAVFKAISLDLGKTWSGPMATTEAEIFELGKTVFEQCFIARPIKINGKKIAQTFPKCSE